MPNDSTPIQAGMSNAERTMLCQLGRQRSRVRKNEVRARKAEGMADFEQQLQHYYRADDDPVWKELKDELDQTTKRLDAKLRARCEELGVPKKFMPRVYAGWQGQTYAIAAEQAAARRAAQARADAWEREAFARIDADDLRYQSEVLGGALTSSEAKGFLEQLKPIEAPALKLEEILRLEHRGA